MPDNPEPGVQEPENESAPKPKVKRISNKRPKKSDSEKSSRETVAEKSESAPDPSENGVSGIPRDNTDPFEPQKKRSNRRRRGKGKSSPKDQQEDSPEEKSNGSDKSEDTDETVQRNQPAPQNSRRRPDPEKVANKAWKIFLAEVSEEGVALIGDNDARELSRRCFRLAELFLEEQQRRG